MLINQVAVKCIKSETKRRYFINFFQQRFPDDLNNLDYLGVWARRFQNNAAYRFADSTSSRILTELGYEDVDEPEVKLHFQWNGMSCQNCQRRNSEGICDLNGKTESLNYCKLYIPSGKLSKAKILEFWKDHQQRFIRERQE